MAKKELVPYYDTQTGEIKDALAEIAAKHAPPPVPQEQLDAWKKAPKEQATKKILELINDSNLDVPEKRFRLDAITKVAEIQGVSAPATQGGQIISIIISTPTVPEKRHVIDVTPVEREEKKEDAPR